MRGFLPSGNTGDTYLRVPQATGVWIQVEFDSLTGAWQCHATNQQHDEHDKRKRSSDVDHLRDRGSQTLQREREARTVAVRLRSGFVVAAGNYVILMVVEVG